MAGLFVTASLAVTAVMTDAVAPSWLGRLFGRKAVFLATSNPVHNAGRIRRRGSRPSYWSTSGLYWPADDEEAWNFGDIDRKIPKGDKIEFRLPLWRSFLSRVTDNDLFVKLDVGSRLYWYTWGALICWVIVGLGCWLAIGNWLARRRERRLVESYGSPEALDLARVMGKKHRDLSPKEVWAIYGDELRDTGDGPGPPLPMKKGKKKPKKKPKKKGKKKPKPAE